MHCSLLLVPGLDTTQHGAAAASRALLQRRIRERSLRMLWMYALQCCIASASVSRPSQANCGLPLCRSVSTASLYSYGPIEVWPYIVMALYSYGLV